MSHLCVTVVYNLKIVESLTVSSKMEHEKPSVIKNDKHLMLIKESKNLSNIESRLFSYYKPSVKHITELDYYDKRNKVVVHINLQKLKEYIEKPAKKLSVKQKRTFYGVTPYGQTFFHILAYMVGKNYTNNEIVDASFKRILTWRFIPFRYVDIFGWNFFNYLIGDDEYVRPDIFGIYSLLVYRGYLPEKHVITDHMIFVQNYYPIWRNLYTTLSTKQMKYISDNMNKYTNENIYNIINMMSFSETISECNDYLVEVSKTCPKLLLSYYNRFLSCIGTTKCCKCINSKYMNRFHYSIVRTIDSATYAQMMGSCQNATYFILKIPDGYNISLFQQAIFSHNFRLAHFFISKMTDINEYRDDFISQLTDDPYEDDQVCAQILIENKELDIIKNIIKISSDSVIIDYVSDYLQSIKPKISCINDEYVCAICWETQNKEGYIYPKCGHYPFCSTCYDRQDVCPFCQSDRGRVSNMMDEISFLSSTKIDIDKIKKWDVSHCI